MELGTVSTPPLDNIREYDESYDSIEHIGNSKCKEVI